MVQYPNCWPRRKGQTSNKHGLTKKRSGHKASTKNDAGFCAYVLGNALNRKTSYHKPATINWKYMHDALWGATAPVYRQSICAMVGCPDRRPQLEEKPETKMSRSEKRGGHKQGKTYRYIYIYIYIMRRLLSTVPGCYKN